MVSLAVFSLVFLLLSSRFPLPSSGSSLMLFWFWSTLPSFLYVLALNALAGYFSLASVLFGMGFCAAVSLLCSFPSHLCFLFLRASFSVAGASSFGFSVMLVFLLLLRDSVESRFLRDGVLPLGRVCSVGCGFSVCCLSCPYISVCPWSSSCSGFNPPGFQDLLELLVTVPVFLPSRRDLLRPPPFLCFHQNLLVLRLPASRISSNPPTCG